MCILDVAEGGAGIPLAMQVGLRGGYMVQAGPGTFDGAIGKKKISVLLRSLISKC